MPGWMGSDSELYHALRTVGADTDESGRFIVRGSITSFMGLGQEFVVGEDALYYINGRACSLSGLMNSTSYGVRNIKVI